MFSQKDVDNKKLLFSIRRWVWQQADEAYSLAPKELVDDWKERLKKVNKMAGAEVVRTKKRLSSSHSQYGNTSTSLPTSIPAVSLDIATGKDEDKIINKNK